MSAETYEFIRELSGHSPQLEAPAYRDRLSIGFVHDGLYPFFKGGAERRLSETARALAKHHEVTYITWQYWQGPSVVIDNGVKLIGVGPAPSFYGDDGKRTVREGLSFASRAARLLATKQFDIVDCCATPILAIYLSWFASKLRRRPLVVTWHEFWGEYWLDYLPERPAVARVARAIERGAVPLADHLVTVSEFTAQKLRRRGVSAPITVVENGVSLPDIDAAEPAPDAPDVLFAGRLIDDKKVDWLVEAMASVRQIHPDVTCGIAGEGPERTRLEKLVAARGLGQTVRFYGFVDDDRFFSLMKGAKVFAFPSIREGFGMAVAEAQACGSVPVVVDAAYNASASLVIDGVNGLVSHPSPAHLATAIDFLLANPELRQAMAANARLTGIDRDWPKIALKLEAVYASLTPALGSVAA